MNKLKVLELFAGIRATSQAMNNLNIPHETFTIEYEKKVQDVANLLHETNDPVRDITKFNIEWLPKHWNKQADLVVAGFPCQPFSMAGKGQGFNDEKGRGKLYQDTLRVIKETNPDYVILENVKAITFQKHKWIIEEIENTLREWGYNVHTQIINAKNYIPQNRERVFVMGSKIKEINPVKEQSHNYILKDFLEKEQEVSQEYFLTQEQINNLKIDINKLKIEDAKKIIKVGNCSKSNHNGLNVYSIKGLMPTFRENHGASIKIIYSNMDYYNADKLEKIFNWKAQEKPLTKIAHPYTKEIKTITTRTEPWSASQQMVMEKICKETEKYIFCNKDSIDRQGDRIFKDNIKAINTLPASCGSYKIINWSEIEKFKNKNLIELIAEEFKTTDYLVKKNNEFYWKLSDGTLRKIGYREKEKNWLLPISKNYTNNIINDVEGILSTLTTSNPKKILLLEGILKENRTNINGLFHNTFNAENYITGVEAKNTGTITATGANSRQKIFESLVPLKIRSITPREALRLMGWRDEYIDKVIHLPKSKLYFTAGNSMVIQVMEAILKRLLNE